MVQRVLADFVLIVHLLFIVFVVAGGLLAFRWRWAPLVQVPAALWGVFIEISGGVCPLTPLENSLRRAAGSAGYAGGFVEHYLFPVVYPESLTQPVQLVLAGLVVVANGLIYSVVLHRRRKHRKLAA